MLALLILRVTGQRAGSCACEQRQQQMNAWGWWGCWRHRDEIIAWLVEEANKRGHAIDDAGALSLFRAAWHEARKR